MEIPVQQLPFDKPGRFWRGNLHSHTTRSDGGLPVEELIAAYRRQGYDFLAVADHFMERFGFPIVDTRPFRDDAFTTLIGAELHAPSLSHGDPWHLVATGIPLDFEPTGRDETGPQLAARAIAAGAFLTIAHPAWYSLSLVDALTIEGAHAVEVYNHTAHFYNDRGDASQMIDQLLMNGRRVNLVAADDTHLNAHPDAFGGWVWVKAPSLDPDVLLAALKAGDFYASQGPVIHHAAIVEGMLEIAHSPARSVFLTGPGFRAESIRGEHLTDSRIPLDKFEGTYCRATIIDEHGRKAWLNPIWLD